MPLDRPMETLIEIEIYVLIYLYFFSYSSHVNMILTLIDIDSLQVITFFWHHVSHTKPFRCQTI
jgi:hypothetical protein